MSGEHTHPDLENQVASVHADLQAAATRLAALDAAQTATDNVIRSLLARLAAVEAGQAALTEGLAAMATWHDYSGKPGGSLLVKAGDYVQLDVDVADPPRTGPAELHLVYANCVLGWRPGEDAGVIRVKYVREDGDETGFADFTCVRGATFGSPPSFLITHTHFEVGQTGLGGRWWIRCGGGLASITVGTRYCKILQVG